MTNTYLRIKMFERRTLESWLTEAPVFINGGGGATTNDDDVEDDSEEMLQYGPASNSAKNLIKDTIVLRIMHHYLEGDLKFPWWDAVVIHENDFFVNYEKLQISHNPLIVISMSQYIVVDKMLVVAFADER